MIKFNILVIVVLFFLVLLGSGENDFTSTHAIGFILFLVPILLSIWALSQDGGKLRKRWAAFVNFLFVVLFTIVLFTIIDKHDAPSIIAFIVVLIVIYTLNDYKLYLKIKDASISRLTKSNDELPPLIKDFSEVDTSSEVRIMTIEDAINADPCYNENYIKRHWKGHFSLPYSYWVNGFILMTVMTMLILGVADSIEGQIESLRLVALISITISVLAIMIAAWSYVGIFRSANRYIAEGKPAFWAGLAKFMVIIGVLGNLNQWYLHIIPQMKEYGLILTGHDPIGLAEMKVSNNGKAIIISKGLGTGSAKLFDQLLSHTSSVTSVILNSSGGRIMEATSIAKTVTRLKLDTYVENECVSACTYIFLAGRDRAATPNAKIGFHQPYFPGVSGEQQKLMTQDMIDQYKQSGLSDQFLQRVWETPPEDMWYPSHEDLLAHKVVTRSSLGGEQSTLVINRRNFDQLKDAFTSNDLIKAYSMRFPGIVDEALMLMLEMSEKGYNDNEILSKGRTVINEKLPVVLAYSDIDILNEFRGLLIEQIEYSLSISPEACDSLLNGTLNIYNVFPQNLIDHEIQFTIKALHNMLKRKPENVDTVEAEELSLKVLYQINPEYYDYYSDPASGEHKVGVMCKASLAYFKKIENLSPYQRGVLLKNAFYQ